MDTHGLDSHCSADHPATYVIRVRGRIPASWQDRFEGMAISTTPASEGPVVTTLQGALADQAALVGIINSLHDLRLAVESVECLGLLPAGDAATPDAPAPEAPKND
jgi:hypothetical protein